MFNLPACVDLAQNGMLLFAMNASFSMVCIGC